MKVYEAIRSVFDDYDEAGQSAEVMVKVPEIVGMLGIDQGYKWLAENEMALLSFYEFKFNHACQNFLNQSRN